MQQQIYFLQEQADAAKAASDSVLPPMPPPRFPPEDALAKNADDVSGVQIQEIQEGDEKMDEVEEEDNGSGVGAFLAPPRKKMKTRLKKALAKNASVKPETRSSVFADAGVLCARELTRVAEECSVLAKHKEDEELAEGVHRELGATVEDNTQLSLSG